MADAVSTQILTESASKIVIKFLNVSDGTGESDVVKVDVSALTPACSTVSIARVQYMTDGMGVRMLWEANADVVALLIPSNQIGDMSFSPALSNNASTGVTGDLAFTTFGHTNGDTYVVILHLRKHV
jgi:hypothetical protein